MYLVIITNIVLIISGLLAIAFYTVSERNFLRYIQYRNGPNNPTLIAIAIPLADALNYF